MDSDRKIPLNVPALILTVVTILYGLITGLMAGPAPPQQFYISMGPLTGEILKKLGLQQFEYSYLLGEYIANNVGLWVVIFFLGSLIPIFTFDILAWNMRMIAQVTMYLPPGQTLAIMMLHGIYEVASLIMVSYTSYCIFLRILQELAGTAKEDIKPVVKLSIFSLMALFMAALIEAYVVPLFVSPSSGSFFLRGVTSTSLYDYIFYLVFLGGAYAIPLIITASVSLEFWEYVFGKEAKSPFPTPPTSKLLPIWQEFITVGVLEELVFRAPVLILAQYYDPFSISVLFSMLFGIAHNSYGIAKIPSSFTVGMIFSAIALHFGLGPAIVAHAFLDIYLTLLAFIEEEILD